MKRGGQVRLIADAERTPARDGAPVGPRRLAAILVADVAGYSSLMHADEDGTHAHFTAAMTRFIEPAIARHGGRLVKNTGDGFVAEFASAVEAVRGTIAFQEQAAAWAAAIPETERLLFRTGINIGDVIVGDDDIFGDSVNVAARLEALARPGGIVISGAVFETLRGPLTARFRDMGGQPIRGIPSPVRAYGLVPAQELAPPAPAGLALPDKPSIAVLPFHNLSGDPHQEYFADGIVADIIAALSQVRSIFVISRNSSLSYKGRLVDVKQVGRELGVRYVLEGSVRKWGDRVRITGELVDAATGMHLWANTFDGPVADIFSLQDQVTASVVATIEPRLRSAEVERARLKSPDSLQAHDLFLRATGHFYSMTREDIEAAIALVTRALELDPRYAPSYALAGRCYFHRKVRGWVAPDDPSIAEGVRLARIGADRGDDNAEVLWMAAIGVGLAGGDIDGAVALIDRALRINPNSAEALTYSGMLRAYQGDTETALAHLARSNRLSPLDVQTYNKHVATAFAHFVAGDYREALAWSERALQHKSDYEPALRMRAACFGLLDRVVEGRQAVARLLAVSPKETLAAIDAYYRVPMKRPEALATLVEGLRRSGLQPGG